MLKSEKAILLNVLLQQVESWEDSFAETKESTLDCQPGFSCQFLVYLALLTSVTVSYFLDERHLGLMSWLSNNYLNPNLNTRLKNRQRVSCGCYWGGEGLVGFWIRISWNQEFESLNTPEDRKLCGNVDLVDHYCQCTSIHFHPFTNCILQWSLEKNNKNR